MGALCNHKAVKGHCLICAAQARYSAPPPSQSAPPPPVMNTIADMLAYTPVLVPFSVELLPGDKTTLDVRPPRRVTLRRLTMPGTSDDVVITRITVGHFEVLVQDAAVLPSVVKGFGIFQLIQVPSQVDIGVEVENRGAEKRNATVQWLTIDDPSVIDDVREAHLMLLERDEQYRGYWCAKRVDLCEAPLVELMKSRAQ